MGKSRLSQNDFDWFAARLSIAVEDTRRLGGMSALELSEYLGFPVTVLNHNGNQIISGQGKDVEVGPMASNAEIRLAFENPFIRTENTKVSISGYQPGAIRDRLNALKNRSAERRNQALAKLDEAGTKHEAVSAEIEQIASKLEKEADDALQEFAEFSNGGPA